MKDFNFQSVQRMLRVIYYYRFHYKELKISIASIFKYLDCSNYDSTKNCILTL